MNTAAAKYTVKQYFQALTDEQRQQYHLTHDCFTGRRLDTPWLITNADEGVDVALEKRQRDLNSLNEVLCPPPTLGSVLGDALAALKLKSAVTEPVVVPLGKPSEDLVNRAKRWFDQYQNAGLAALLPAQSQQLSEANITVVKRAFSSNTLLIQNVCMLSAFWIRSPLDWNAKGDTGLLEHLFVQYEAPAFLKACWSAVADEDNVRWLLCFVLYAQGGSLKALAKHFGWTTVNNKLWHQLFICPAHLSPLHAVLYAEFKRLGGWDEDLACLMANTAYVVDLLDPASEEGRDFWYDTCRWTISQQFALSAEDHSKVLVWARHQLTEYARNGEVYRLQGRSQAKVLESIAAYEREQLRLEQARARMAARARQVSMARLEERERLRAEQEELDRHEYPQGRYDDDYYDYEPVDASWKKRGWDWVGTVHGKRWKIIELTSSEELYEEGEAMEHCVGSYSLSCVNGGAAIFSLRCEGYRKATIEVDPVIQQLIQVQGACNSEPRKSVIAVVNAWVERVVKW